jgi:glycosyltransferase involved in cell wall biosynthesis
MQASIIINNYNYGRFLSEAIDSALNQTYPHVEVIVVDDGSTDDSRAIVAEYGGRVQTVFKPNGGQASAFNAGLAASVGKFVLYLDADDILLPTALEAAIPFFADPEVVKVHWSLREIDEAGTRTGRLVPPMALPDGDLRQTVLRLGPTNCPSAPTSGNVWRRSFLEEIFPIPEQDYRIGADTYLFELAPFFGPIRHVAEPQALYRLHSNNNWSRMSFDEKLRHELTFYARHADLLARRCETLRLAVDRQAWEAASWWHRLKIAIEELGRVIPCGQTFLLVDDDTIDLGHLGDRPRKHFLERQGLYWGPPADDATAIRELGQELQAGTSFLVFAWPAFWWLEHYTEFAHHLRSHFPCVLENERVVVFHLQGQLRVGLSPSRTQHHSSSLFGTRPCPEGGAL